MNAALYASLQIPKPFVILGLRLKPYCIGHKVLLRRIESPIECGGNITVSDISVAIMLCSLTYEQGIEALDGDIRPAIKRWIGKVKKPIDWNEKATLFNEYIGYHSQSYGYNSLINDAGSCAKSETPEPHATAIALMKMLHMTESQAMNRCYGLALCDYAVCLEQEGRVVVTDREKIAEMKRELAEFAESLAKGEVEL